MRTTFNLLQILVYSIIISLVGNFDLKSSHFVWIKGNRENKKEKKLNLYHSSFFGQ